MSTLRLTIVTVLITGLALTAAAQEKNPAFAKIEDDPKLPRVLILGDSISIGYTVPVRDLLKGKANLHRPADNCGPTTRGLTQLDKWLGSGKWDVIHFNFGLHDIKYMNEKGELIDTLKGKQQVSIADYEKNLRTIVDRLKKTNAKLIWCATTPVPEGAKGRVVGDEVKYNAVAAKIMKEEGIAINHLYTVAAAKLDKIQKPKDVHFTDAGSKELAGHVVKAITKELGSN